MFRHLEGISKRNLTTRHGGSNKKQRPKLWLLSCQYTLQESSERTKVCLPENGRPTNGNGFRLHCPSNSKHKVFMGSMLKRRPAHIRSRTMALHLSRMHARQFGIDESQLAAASAAFPRASIGLRASTTFLRASIGHWGLGHQTETNRILTSLDPVPLCNQSYATLPIPEATFLSLVQLGPRNGTLAQ